MLRNPNAHSKIISSTIDPSIGLYSLDDINRDINYLEHFIKAIDPYSEIVILGSYLSTRFTKYVIQSLINWCGKRNVKLPYTILSLQDGYSAIVYRLYNFPELCQYLTNFPLIILGGVYDGQRSFANIIGDKKFATVVKVVSPLKPEPKPKTEPKTELKSALNPNAKPFNPSF